jgi:ribonuclease VapC
MVIDTSALVAVFLAEPERKRFVDLIIEAPMKLVSAANVLETGIVLEAKRGEGAGREFDLFVVRANLEVVPQLRRLLRVRSGQVFGRTITR